MCSSDLEKFQFGGAFISDTDHCRFALLFAPLYLSKHQPRSNNAGNNGEQPNDPRAPGKNCVELLPKPSEWSGDSLCLSSKPGDGATHKLRSFFWFEPALAQYLSS